jgi:hypothetical protein
VLDAGVALTASALVMSQYSHPTTGGICWPLTSFGGIHLEQLTAAQIVNKFLAFCEIPKITGFTGAPHWATI